MTTPTADARAILLLESGDRPVHAAVRRELAMQRVVQGSVVDSADFHVPGTQNGVEFVRKARAMKWPRLEVLFISGDLDTLMRETRGVSGTRQLRKPFDAADFEREVQALLAAPCEAFSTRVIP